MLLYSITGFLLVKVINVVVQYNGWLPPIVSLFGFVLVFLHGD